MTFRTIVGEHKRRIGKFKKILSNVDHSIINYYNYCIVSQPIRTGGVGGGRQATICGWKKICKHGDGGGGWGDGTG